MKVKKIMVIGAGFMGCGISQTAAEYEYQVLLYDIDQPKITKGLDSISFQLTKRVKKGKITEDEKQVVLSRIISAENLEKAAECELVIEAIVENKTIKGEVFASLDKICHEKTVLASNTSSIPITDLAAFTKRPDRFIGMHFFSPVPVMQLVEIITGLKTSEETFSTAWEVAKNMKKEPVRVKDGPGFLVNRINNAMRLEAYRCLIEGVATIEDIDKAMKLGVGYAMGPFEQNDFTGLDVGLNVIETLWQSFRDSKWCPPVILRKLVVSGDLGRKTGRGWYDYSEGQKKPRTDVEY